MLYISAYQADIECLSHLTYVLVSVSYFHALDAYEVVVSDYPCICCYLFNFSGEWGRTYSSLAPQAMYGINPTGSNEPFLFT